MLSRGGKVAKGKGDLSREKWSGAHRWQGGNYWAGLRLRLRDSELLGRVEVAAGAASACRPWTKADTHGTSTRAGLHNFKLNIWHIFAKNCKCKVFTVILGLPAWMYQIHHAPYLCLAKSVPWSSFQQMKAGCSESKVLTFCEIW